jgi:hypothetical protein
MQQKENYMPTNNCTNVFFWSSSQTSIAQIFGCLWPSVPIDFCRFHVNVKEYQIPRKTIFRENKQIIFWNLANKSIDEALTIMDRHPPDLLVVSYSLAMSEYTTSSIAARMFLHQFFQQSSAYDCGKYLITTQYEQITTNPLSFNLFKLDQEQHFGCFPKLTWSPFSLWYLSTISALTWSIQSRIEELAKLSQPIGAAEEPQLYATTPVYFFQPATRVVTLTNILTVTPTPSNLHNT